MRLDDGVWDEFTIRAYRDPAAGDARRVIFELKGDPPAHPAAVVLRAGGGCWSGTTRPTRPYRGSGERTSSGRRRRW